MSNIVIEKYEDLLSFFEDCIKNTKIENIKEDLKKSYLNIASELVKINGKDLEFYTKRINSQNDINITNFNLEEYIYNNVYRNANPEIGNTLQNLVSELESIVKLNDENLINKWVDIYKLFVDKYKDVVDSEKLLEYMNVLLQKTKNITINKMENTNKELNANINTIEGKVTTEKDESLTGEVNKEKKDIEEEKAEQKKQDVEDKTNQVEPLKIINVKKPNISKKMNNSLKVLALLGIGGTLGLPAALLSLCVYLLNKKFKLSNKFISYLNKHGFSVNDDNQLLDQNGKVFDEKQIEKEKASFLKQKLINLNKFKDNGFIKNSYKKNKLTSMLLNMKIVNSIKNKFKKEEVLDKKYDNNNDDMYKGLVKC